MAKQSENRYKDFDKLKINPLVMDYAKRAYAESLGFDYGPKADIGSSMPDEVEEAIEVAIRAAIQRGRQAGWFDLNCPVTAQWAGKMPAGQCYKIHIVGDDEPPHLPPSRYRFHEMEVGKKYLIQIMPDRIDRLRAAATSYGKDHGMQFSINKRMDGAIVTRLS